MLPSRCLFSARSETSHYGPTFPLLLHHCGDNPETLPGAPTVAHLPVLRHRRINVVAERRLEKLIRGLLFVCPRQGRLRQSDTTDKTEKEKHKTTRRLAAM